MADPGVVIIHTDGAARGNPGPAAFAYVIARDGEEPIEEAGCLGRMTNNQAEYTALVRALEHALEVAPDSPVVLHSDSELMVKQMKGEYKVKNEDLRDLSQQARRLVARFPQGVTFKHVRREQNARADALGNEALEGLRSPTPRASTIQRPARPAAAPAPPAPTLREQVLACLTQARAAWSAGAGEPTPEAVWMQLQEILQRHGARVPPRPG
jgi:ribonuclease HI